MAIYVCPNCAYKGMEEVEGGGGNVLQCPVCGVFSTTDDAPILAGE